MEVENIRATSLKVLLLCCFDFDPKISATYIYLVYHLSHFYLNCHMVQDCDVPITCTSHPTMYVLLFVSELYCEPGLLRSCIAVFSLFSVVSNVKSQ